MSADETSPDDPLLDSVRQSGLFGSRRQQSEGAEAGDLAPPSLAAVREAVASIDSAVDLGVAADDLEHHVREVCARCFPGRSAVLDLDDAPEHPGLSSASAEHFGISEAMLDESGIDLVEAYALRYDPSVFGFDVPIQSDGKLLGVIALEYPEEPAALDEDREALALLAFTIGSALSRARANDDARRLVERLRHSQKLATIGELSASIAHELNHPLTTVSVYADLLHRRAESAERDEWETVRLARIVSASERMQAYLRDLINFSRPSRRERTYESPRSLVERALSICEPVVAQAGASVTVEIEDQASAIYCVGSQVEQMLVNLVVNAAHAVDSKGGSIRVRGEAHDGTLKITVEDDGPGIPDEHKEAVFDAFFSTKAPGAGTGLGLSIVHRIVEDHGGSVRVEDGERGGAAFVVELPGLRS